MEVFNLRLLATTAFDQNRHNITDVFWNKSGINKSSDYAYRILTNSLKTNHITWFSYENKKNGNIKVMIKN
jgi:hypothetical protein